MHLDILLVYFVFVLTLKNKSLLIPIHALEVPESYVHSLFYQALHNIRHYQIPSTDNILQLRIRIYLTFLDFTSRKSTIWTDNKRCFC